MKSYYYLHKNGTLIYKPDTVVESAGGPNEYFDSPFVKAWWSMDSSKPNEVHEFLHDAKRQGVDNTQLRAIAGKFNMSIDVDIRESVNTIMTPDSNLIKEYAKSAIRDVFIQMPTRTVNKKNWDGYINQISSTFGQKETQIALEELRRDGWLFEQPDYFRWKSAYSTINSRYTLKEGKLNENDNHPASYGCLMLQLEAPQWNRLHSIVESSHIYNESGFGVESDPHVTVLYGFDTSVNPNHIQSDLSKIIRKPISVNLNGLSHFPGEKYDVLKFDVESDSLHMLNKYFKKYPHVDTHPEYHPHATLSYLQPGLGIQYNKQLSKPYTFIGKTFKYSHPNGDKFEWKIPEKGL